MNEVNPSQPAASTQEASDELKDYLSQRDQCCPSCGVNLRGGQTSTCVKCGHELSVRALLASRGAKAAVPVLAVRVLALIAFAVAAYLAFTSVTNSQPAGCSPGAGCGDVLSSSWASLWNVPVSLPGVVIYFSILLLTFHLSPSQTDHRRKVAWSLLIGLSVCAGLAAIWFIYLQVFQIKSICPYCMVDHTCGLLIAALVLYSAPLGRGEVLDSGQRSSLSITPGRGASVIAVAGLAMGLFIVAQIMFPAPTHRLMVTPDPSGGQIAKSGGDPEPAKAKDHASNKDGTAKDGGSVNVPPAGKQNDLTLLPTTDPSIFVRLPRAKTEGGLVRFQRNAMPVRGNINAKVMLVCMVDYTCPHCRELHHLFDEAWKRYGDDLAFMMVPMPLNPQCNPYIDFADPRHAAACDLARVALAVWKTDATKFAMFDEWLFEPEKARTGDEARAKAEELVGKEALKAVFDTGWPHEQALKHVRLYEMAGLGRIPKIMYSNVRVEGSIQKEDFWTWLESSDGPGLTRIK